MKKFQKSTRKAILTYALVGAAFLIVQTLLASGNMSASLQGQLVPICAYVVMAVSLNLTVGILGELSLGHAGFMSVGAFTGVVACMSLENIITVAPLRLLAGMIIGAIFAGIVGILIGIPVLRLNGDYLAIVTLAFGEIIKNLITCLYVGLDSRGLHISFLTSAKALNLEEGGKVLINGPIGMAGVPKLSTFTAGFVLVMVTLFIVMNLINSRSGRAIMALRDNSIAAESVGIPATKYKLIAFVTSAALAGAAGTLYTMNFSTVVATKFNLNTSILILVFVVLGGLGNIWGSVVAAAILTILPEMLRGFNDFRMLVYAIVLVLVMLATNSNSVKGVLARLKKRSQKKGAEKEGASNV